MKRAAVVAVAVGTAAVSCIIPDRDIQFEGGPANPGAVRILDRTPLPPAWTQWCLDRDLDDDIDTAAFCHSARDTRGGGLIRPEEDGAFCVCPEGQRDERAPALWTIYAEDPDLDGEARKDTLYGVLLRDPDPSGDSPEDAIAYENYLERCGPGIPLDKPSLVTFPLEGEDGPAYSERVLPPVARNTAPLWEFPIDDAVSERIDLCNDDNGDALAPGLHTLQFLVTDRPFFEAVREEADGSVVTKEQCGVPDIAAGATYATIHYVFECVDGTLEENQDVCACNDA
jgi:hypothetical protein